MLSMFRLIVLAAAAVTLVAGGRAATQEAPGGRTRDLVSLDAVVTDEQGRKLVDLKASDFELVEDGSAQEIERVDLLSAEPKPRNRTLALFLDEYHVTDEMAPSVQESVGRFLDADVRDDDVLFVMKPLDPVASLQPSRGREAVRQALTAFTGRKGDYSPRTPFEQTYIGRAPEVVSAARAQVVLAALRTLATQLGAAGADRKALILISEGFVRDASGRGRERLPDGDAVVRAATRGGVVIHAIVPARSAVGGGEAGIDRGLGTLRSLAHRTGGLAVENAGDLGATLRTAMQDLTGYYRVTYRPSREPDGRFHAIALRVRRPKADVRTGAGYWSSAPAVTRAIEAAAAGSAARLSPANARMLRVSPLIDAWFGVTRGAEGRTRVTVVWERSARRRTGVKPADVDIVRVNAKAANGTPLFSGHIAPVGGVAGGALPDKAVFEVAPGRIDLDMSLESGDRRVLDVDARYLDVRDLHRDQTMMGTPEVLRARTLREFRALSADPDAAPVVIRQFRRTERLLIRVAAYGPGGTRPTLDARLVNRAGQTLRTLAQSAGDSGVAQFDLSLAPFAPGEYRIELIASSGSGRATDTIAFRVTS
jgi:VWFA-related protein